MSSPIVVNVLLVVGTATERNAFFRECCKQGKHTFSFRGIVPDDEGTVTAALWGTRWDVLKWGRRWDHDTNTTSRIVFQTVDAPPDVWLVCAAARHPRLQFTLHASLPKVAKTTTTVSFTQDARGSRVRHGPPSDSDTMFPFPMSLQPRIGWEAWLCGVGAATFHDDALPGERAIPEMVLEWITAAARPVPSLVPLPPPPPPPSAAVEESCDNGAEGTAGRIPDQVDSGPPALTGLVPDTPGIDVLLPVRSAISQVPQATSNSGWISSKRRKPE